MSYTLKKLKQSEINSGYRKPLHDSRIPSSYGLYIFVFVIILLALLFVVKQTQQLSSQQSILSSKQDIHNSNQISENLLPSSKQGIYNSNKISDNTETIILGNNSDINQVDTLSVITETKIDKSAEIINHVEPQINNSSQKNNDALVEKPVLFSELSESMQNEIPKIKLNGIIFLENEDDRYVLINMIKYYVDDDVDFDLFIDKILQNSVVMSYKNKQFVISMQ